MQLCRYILHRQVSTTSLLWHCVFESWHTLLRWKQTDSLEGDYHLVMARLWLKDWLPLNPVVNHGLSLYCFIQIAIWRACKPCEGKPMRVLGNDSTFQLGNHMFSHLNWRKNEIKSRFQVDCWWYTMIYGDISISTPQKTEKNYDGWLWTSMILASKTTHWCRQSFF